MASLVKMSNVFGVLEYWSTGVLGYERDQKFKLTKHSE
jgi:hypothetical protein